MGTLRFILRRFLWSLVALLGLSMLIFVISRIVPGDVARVALGPGATESAIANLREQMHLDEPIYSQYIWWLGNILKGDFGISLMTSRPVLKDIQEFLPATFELVIFAAGLQILFGILLGVLSSMYDGKLGDYVFRLFAYLGIVTPSFVFAVVFMLLFGYLWPVLPVIGRLSESITVSNANGFVTWRSFFSGEFEVWWDSVQHLLAPAIALSLSGMAQLARITRSSLVNVLSNEYISMEKAQGISFKKIFFKYALRPALIPGVSVMAMQFASLFSNAFLIELIFNWPGFSRYAVQGMLFKDLNVISAVVCVLGAIFIFANILCDIIVSLLDPRVRLTVGGTE